jgi:hypothetical protein
MAIAFDMAATAHSGLPLYQNQRVTLYGSNPSKRLLSLREQRESITDPVNFAVIL